MNSCETAIQEAAAVVLSTTTKKEQEAEKVFTPPEEDLCRKEHKKRNLGQARFSSLSSFRNHSSLEESPAKKLKTDLATTATTMLTKGRPGAATDAAAPDEYDPWTLVDAQDPYESAEATQATAPTTTTANEEDDLYPPPQYLQEWIRQSQEEEEEEPPLCPTSSSPSKDSDLSEPQQQQHVITIPQVTQIVRPRLVSDAHTEDDKWHVEERLKKEEQEDLLLNDRSSRSLLVSLLDLSLYSTALYALFQGLKVLARPETAMVYFLDLQCPMTHALRRAVYSYDPALLMQWNLFQPQHYSLCMAEDSLLRIPGDGIMSLLHYNSRNPSTSIPGDILPQVHASWWFFLGMLAMAPLLAAIPYAILANGLQGLEGFLCFAPCSFDSLDHHDDRGVRQMAIRILQGILWMGRAPIDLLQTLLGATWWGFFWMPYRYVLDPTCAGRPSYLLQAWKCVYEGMVTLVGVALVGRGVMWYATTPLISNEEKGITMTDWTVFLGGLFLPGMMRCLASAFAFYRRQWTCKDENTMEMDG